MDLPVRTRLARGLTAWSIAGIVLLLGAPPPNPSRLPASPADSAAPSWTETWVAGVRVESDPELPFPIARPSLLPEVVSGRATIEELVEEGRKAWDHGDGTGGEPFTLPDSVVRRALIGKGFMKLVRKVGLKIITAFRPWPLIPDDEGFVGVGTIRPPGEVVQTTANCASCHSARIRGRTIPGLANQHIDQLAAFQQAIGVLEEGRRDRDAMVRDFSARQLERARRFSVLNTLGCEPELRTGTSSGVRIWYISAGLLTDIAQLATEEGRRAFPCGGSIKIPSLLTAKFKNISYHDGKLNSSWNSELPPIDLATFGDPLRLHSLLNSRQMQALNAYVYFGMRSPSWEEVMGKRPEAARARRGFEIFHQREACAGCHGTYTRDGMLSSYRVSLTPVEVVRTDGEKTLSTSAEAIQGLLDRAGAKERYVANMRPFRDTPMGYTANPLCSVAFAFPYLHTGSVANLRELLLPEDQRSLRFYRGDEVDEDAVGFPTRAAPRFERFLKANLLSKVEVPRRLVRGHSGKGYGTELGESDRTDLIEYLKSLRCPDGI